MARPARQACVASLSSGCQVRAVGFCTLPSRMQRVQTQIRRTAPSTTARTRCRLGRKRLEVTLCAWLMLRPVTVFFSQIAHCLDMSWDLLRGRAERKNVSTNQRRREGPVENGLDTTQGSCYVAAIL